MYISYISSSIQIYIQQETCFQNIYKEHIKSSRKPTEKRQTSTKKAIQVTNKHEKVLSFINPQKCKLNPQHHITADHQNG